MTAVAFQLLALLLGFPWLRPPSKRPLASSRAHKARTPSREAGPSAGGRAGTLLCSQALRTPSVAWQGSPPERRGLPRPCLHTHPAVPPPATLSLLCRENSGLRFNILLKSSLTPPIKVSTFLCSMPGNLSL